MGSRSSDLPEEIDEYIKESFDYSLGLPVSIKTLQMKLQASEEARRRLQDQYYFIHSRLKEKDETIDRARSEASMNAQALKKFVEENQKLAVECSSLLSQCSRWEKECSLYDRDREMLMEFANEADERAKEADALLLKCEDELRRLREEGDLYKNECEMHRISEKKATEELHLLRERIKDLELLRLQGCDGDHLGRSQCSSKDNRKQRSHVLSYRHEDLSAFNTTLEEHLLDSVMPSVIDKDEVAASAHDFLEANSGVESCQKLLQMWECLRPSTQNIIALAAKIKTLKNDKEHLRINLTRAEEEVKVLFEENNILDEDNKLLLRQYNRERHHQGSGGKHSNSTSAKGNKRKSSPKTCSSVDRLVDFSSSDSPRQPLSPLRHNSPNSKMHKK